MCVGGGLADTMKKLSITTEDRRRNKVTIRQFNNAQQQLLLQFKLFFLVVVIANVVVVVVLPEFQIRYAVNALIVKRSRTTTFNTRSGTSFAYIPHSNALLQQQKQQPQPTSTRKGLSNSELLDDTTTTNNDQSSCRRTTGTLLFNKASFSSSLSSPTIRFIDPQTQCNVVLLGCFHGTTSSAQDVQDVVTVDTDIVVLELCIQRYTDLLKRISREQNNEEEEKQQLTTGGEGIGRVVVATNTNNNVEEEIRMVRPSVVQKKQQPWWPKSYIRMVSKTIQTQGLATGLAACLLGGVSGFQSAISGFTPGLEFTTAIGLLNVRDEMNDDDDVETYYNFDIVLADQDVDETLRKLGNLPTVVVDILFGSNMCDDGIQKAWNLRRVVDECRFHLATGHRAIFGDSQLQPTTRKTTTSPISLDQDLTIQRQLPQVQLLPVLLRNEGAIQDLIRLILPSTGLVYVVSRLVAAALGADEIDAESYNMILSSVTTTMMTEDTMSTTTAAAGTIPFSMVVELVRDVLSHLIVSGMVVSTGFLALVPVVKVILTERDEILANGIRSACRRAGKGGHVVAVLGLLHVNGVARRMILGDDDEDVMVERKNDGN